MQTCRRHPEAGHFMATCPGCARDLHDMQQANLVHAEATKALALIGMTVGPHLTILTAIRTEKTLVVATHQPDAPTFAYGIDVFRLPTPAETDPDLADDYRLTPGQWLLDWQAGDTLPDAIPGMLADAHTHLLARNLVTDDTHTTT
jgi:hypothetical protein